MKMRNTCLSVGLALLAVLLVFRTTVNARRVRLWDFADMAKEAEALVVGEVLSVATTGKIEADKTHWQEPLLKMTATIRVIRTFPDPCKDLEAGRQFEIDYLNHDPEKLRPQFNGATFPNLSPGEVLIFPLRKNKADHWELPDEEDNSLLVPAVADTGISDVEAKTLAGLIAQLGVDEFEKREEAQKQLIAKGRPALKTIKAEATRATDAESKNRLAKIIGALGGNSAVEFLQAEYANTLAIGDVRTMYRAADWMGLKRDDIKSVEKYLAMTLGNDANRWMQILAALFAGSSPEKVTLAEWVEKEDNGRDIFREGRRKFAALIWPRISKEKLDEQIIAQACAPGVPYRFSEYLLKANKLADHPLTVKLLLAALQAQRPEAVSLTYQLLRDRKKIEPLVVAAVSSACKLISSDQKLEYDDFYLAFRIIIAWGQEEDCRLLLDTFKTAQKNNREKYLKIWNIIWNSLNWAAKARFIPFCAVVLNDPALHEGGDMRNCDSAVFLLQPITGQDFGMKEKLSIEERNAAVEKAKAWLAENPNWTAKTETK